MEESAAVSSGCLPDVRSRFGSWGGTLPSRLILKVSITMPLSPMSADSGITVYQLSLTLAIRRCR